MKRATTAIITTAGYGTRRLPVTKSLEKSMLPLGNRPVIDYLVEDCARAGIKDIYFVVSGPATQLRSYYERNVELEGYLDSVGKPQLAKAIMPPDGVRFHYIEQDLSDGRYGTTIPVWLARDYIPKDELVVITCGDAAIRDSDGSSSLRTMIEKGEPALLAVKVADDVDLSKTGGVIAVNEQGGFKAIVEHADPAVEPSRLKNSGFYLVPGSIVDLATAQVQNGDIAPNGEYQLTSVINDLAKQHPLKVAEATGVYLDAGDAKSWVEANVQLLEWA